MPRKTGNVGVTLSVNEQTFTTLAVQAASRGMQVRDLMRELLDNAAKVYDGVLPDAPADPNQK